MTDPITPNESDDSRDIVVSAFLAAALALALLVAYALWAKSEFGDLGERGQFGDSFGAVSVLVSAFAFIALIASIQLQMQEFREQRKVLGLQHEELQLQRDQLELQREEMILQRKEMADSTKALSRSGDIAAFATFLDFYKSVVAVHISAEQIDLRASADSMLERMEGGGNYYRGIGQTLAELARYYDAIAVFVRNWPEEVAQEWRDDFLQVLASSSTVTLHERAYSSPWVANEDIDVGAQNGWRYLVEEIKAHRAHQQSDES